MLLFDDKSSHLLKYCTFNTNEIIENVQLLAHLCHNAQTFTDVSVCSVNSVIMYTVTL